MIETSALLPSGAPPPPGLLTEPVGPDAARSLPPCRPSRAVVELVRPLVDGGRFAAKASIGSPLTVEADVFTDGHDPVAASAWLWTEGSAAWQEVPMRPTGNDRFRAVVQPETMGLTYIVVTGWVDQFAGWRSKLLAELDAQQEVTLTLSDAEPLFREAATRAASAGDGEASELLEVLVSACAGRSLSPALTDPTLPAAMRRHGDRSPEARSPAIASVWVDRELARFGSWYEFFPRSDWTSSQWYSPGRLDTLDVRLDYIAELGFDIVYLPPIHPIGEVNRKGPNNAVLSNVDDVGSPWAIGVDNGGHFSVEPSLGTVTDLEQLVRSARRRGLELAMDIAFQCAPDHPWVRDHPSWFRYRSDGTIRHAENPPKRYEDIVPLDFATEDWESLWHELRRVFWFWIERGVRIFRVDNPHTKAFAFWEWCIATTRDQWPDVIFLAEAFTRPRVMERLAKAGFTQSYTYFTWRSTGDELRRYGEELADETTDVLRPNLWPNTPDILTDELQHGGRPTFAARAVLASTLSPSWGIYGPAFELGEHQAVKEGSEEYLDSEKYQRRSWVIDQRHSLAPFIRHLNQIRRTQPALQHMEGLRFHDSTDPQVLCYSKPDPDGPGGVLIVVNLDPHARHGATVDVDWAALDLAYDASYELIDLLGGGSFTWHGARNYVELEAHGLNAHVFAVSGPAAGLP